MTTLHLFQAAKLAVSGDVEGCRDLAADLPRDIIGEPDYLGFVQALLHAGLLAPAEALMGDAIAALNRAGAADAREALLAQATIWFPDNVSFSADYAILANLRHDWAEAASRWQIVRARQPDWAHAQMRTIEALREAGQVAAAEVIGRVAIAQFPDDEELAMQYAKSVHYQGDLAAAARVWHRMRERFPNAHEAYAWGVIALRGCHDTEAEEALVGESVVRFAENASFAMQYAEAALHRQDWQEANRRLDRVRARFPEFLQGYTHGAHALLRLGEFALAEALIREGLARFPLHSELLRQDARIAMTREDWPEALRRLEYVMAVDPSSPAVEYDIETVRLNLRLERPDGRAKADPPAKPFGSQAAMALPKSPDDAAKTPLRNLMMRFESLGDNCEFGLVQRHEGAEPIGLLRWAGIGWERLRAALDTRFAGIGDEATTRLFQIPHHDEYMLEDTRYFSMHTFIGPGPVPAEKLLAQMCRRLVFLGQKLIEDLEAGEKLFVYKSSTGVFPDGEMEALHRAVRAYGPVTLLCVRAPDGSNPARSVTQVAPGLLLGHLEDLSPDPWRFRSPKHQAAWIELCQSAWRLSRLTG